jgi:hypothetical protein
VKDLLMKGISDQRTVGTAPGKSPAHTSALDAGEEHIVLPVMAWAVVFLCHCTYLAKSTHPTFSGHFFCFKNYPAQGLGV